MGLEVRVPILGNEVLDFALSLSDRIHFKNGVWEADFIGFIEKILTKCSLEPQETWIFCSTTQLIQKRMENTL